MQTAHVPEPTLEMTDGTPMSAAFGDVYFSKHGGVAETSHVFLGGNGLPQRWAGCARVAFHGEPAGQGSAQRRGQGPLQSTFSIAELGFGTGLNFLVTLKRFRETAPPNAVLHYQAVEKFPFTREALTEILSLQPELAAEAVELLANYPLRLPGAHRIHLPRCVLTLCWGEVGEWLLQLETSLSAHSDGSIAQRTSPPRGGSRRGAGVGYGLDQNQPPPLPSPSGGGLFALRASASRIDAWYLDGFAPAKNPDMWTAEIFAAMARASSVGATFATFTAASAVRRGLEAAGFAVEKVPGFGKKREMLKGVIRVEGRESSGTRAQAASSLDSGHAILDASVLILGAGIAGATLARALAERGFRVTVIERADAASGASGNSAGVLFPPLQKKWNAASAFYFSAYDFTLRQLARWKSHGLVFAGGTPGMLRLPRHDEEAVQLTALGETLGLDAGIVHWLDRAAASEQAGVALQSGAAFFPQGTWVSPRELCHALLQHEAILLHEHTAAKSIAREGGDWVVTLTEGEPLRARVLCVASAVESAEMLAEYGLKLSPVGGQISEIAAGDAAATLRSILCRRGYVIPRGDTCLVGATYHREHFLDVTDARHAENIAELKTMLPGWGDANILEGRSAIRATTPDRLPYVGVLEAGLYVSVGHGSRGLLSAPLAAEMIASELCGEIAPVRAALAYALRPTRFTKA